MTKRPLTDAELQCIADFDQHLGAVNATLREVRKLAERHQAQPLGAFAVELGTRIANKLNEPDVCVSRLMRRYARLIEKYADGVDKCEASHPGQQCGTGKLALCQMTFSFMLSIHAVAAGLELSRGRWMKDVQEELDDHV